MTKARKKQWSYSAGERGRNRVRAFERAADGRLFLEWTEPASRDVLAAGGGRSRIKRLALPSNDREKAKAAAEALAARMRNGAPTLREHLTLRALFDNYLREVSPAKGESKRKHDARAARLFLECFGAERKVSTLSVRDWQRFIQLRRSGALAPNGVRKRSDTRCGDALVRIPVRDRGVAYDLQFLQAVLNWAALAGDGAGGTLLDRNPLRGLSLPREESPKRPVLTDDQYMKLREVALEVSPLLQLALVIAHETGHRVGSIRLLRWSDIDLEGGRIRWRAENDKIGLEHSPVASSECLAVLKAVRRQASAIGDTWLFPGPGDAARPCSRHLMRDWWQRAAQLAGLPEGERLGWHALRRKFATELKTTPLKDLCYMGGWKNPQTILTCYQLPDDDTQRQAFENRIKVRAASN